MAMDTPTPPAGNGPPDNAGLGHPPLPPPAATAAPPTAAGLGYPGPAATWATGNTGAVGQTASRQSRVALAVALAVVAVCVAVGVALALGDRGPATRSASADVHAPGLTPTRAPSSVPAFAYPASAVQGGSGDTSPSAITTSADCPASLGATLNKPTYPNGPTGAHIDTSKNYTATVTTDVGSFTIVLAPKAAPLAVNSFVFLARQHFFDCVVFHRVIPGFVDQTGDPTGTGTGGPGYKFADELPAKAAPQYPLGSVAMANAGPDTNGSQFFIVTGPPGETLPPSYTLFGRVTSGMNVVQKINADGTDTGAPNVEHRIISITISES